MHPIRKPVPPRVCFVFFRDVLAIQSVFSDKCKPPLTFGRLPPQDTTNSCYLLARPKFAHGGVAVVVVLFVYQNKSALFQRSRLCVTACFLIFFCNLFLSGGWWCPVRCIIVFVRGASGQGAFLIDEAIFGGTQEGSDGTGRYSQSATLLLSWRVVVCLWLGKDGKDGCGVVSSIVSLLLFSCVAFSFFFIWVADLSFRCEGRVVFCAPLRPEKVLPLSLSLSLFGRMIGRCGGVDFEWSATESGDGVFVWWFSGMRGRVRTLCWGRVWSLKTLL